jgi:hypothetical protein
MHGIVNDARMVPIAVALALPVPDQCRKCRAENQV